MPREFDLVVVGSGVAARSAALAMAADGWSVAVVDRKPLGGTCVLRGCDPKKVLVNAAETEDQARRLRGRGVRGEAGLDWRDLIAFKRGFTDDVPGKQQEMYADKGVATFRGTARFTGRRSLDVDGERLEAGHVLIASGARPVPLGMAGEEHLMTHEGFMELESLPKRVVLVGGGYIASEFAHVAARAGAEVTVLQRGARMLKPFDPDLVGWLMPGFAEAGIDVRTNTEVTSIEPGGGGFRVLTTSEGQDRAMEADLVVHAAGRVPDLDDLDLAQAGVETSDGRLRLNACLQSVSNPAVYAAGDAAQNGPPLTPTASRDADVVVQNLKGGTGEPDYRGMPSVAFTIPPIASVGLAEAAAREQGLSFSVNSGDAADWFTARARGATVYGYKLLVETGSERILGAHLVGPHAEEVINIFALAIRHGLTAADLRASAFAYPTAASDIGAML